MSRAKLFNMVKSRGENKPLRNDFDLTNRHVYTSKAGRIVPVKAIHTYPEDYFEVNMSEFSQNNIPLNTAAFLAGKKELLAYFVPYNTIWHNFNQYQATREDPESTLLKERGISYEPRMSIMQMYDAAVYFAIISWLYNSYVKLYALQHVYHEYGQEFDDGTKGSEIIEFAKATIVTHGLSTVETYSLWDRMLEISFNYLKTDSKYKYSNFYHATDPDSFIFSVPFYFREYSHDNVTSFSLFDTATNMFGNFIWCDWIQKLDMLGYGNIYPIVYTMVQELEKETDDIINNCVVRTSSGYTSLYFGREDLMDSDLEISTNTQGFGNLFNIVRFYRGKLRSFCTYTADGVTLDEYLNVYSIFAYNKCFYDFMRNVYFDTEYSVYNYNCDFIDGTSLEGSKIIQSDLPLRWYHLEYHQWKKDMFTGVLPDNQLGQVSSLILHGDVIASTSSAPTGVSSYPPVTGGNLSNVMLVGESDKRYPFVNPNRTVSVDGSNPESPTNFQLRTPHTHLMPTQTVTGVSASLLDVLAFKRAEAIQQYRQDLMRAGNRTKDVFKQVYGSEPKSQLDEAPYFIEVQGNDININPIISTASTGEELNGKLGDIAARCTISGNSLDFKFSTKDFGVVLLLSYVVPESFYNSCRIDPMNTHLDQESHGLPYFQNLGLMPVIGEYLSNLHSHDVRSSTRGFAPPYLEFKTDIDQVHGNLVDVTLEENGSIDMDYQGSLSHWAVVRNDMQSEKTLSLRNFYINPRILNNVFTFKAEDNYETDHFLNYCSISVKSVRAFSELGLPKF